MDWINSHGFLALMELLVLSVVSFFYISLRQSFYGYSNQSLSPHIWLSRSTVTCSFSLKVLFVHIPCLLWRLLGAKRIKSQHLLAYNYECCFLKGVDMFTTSTAGKVACLLLSFSNFSSDDYPCPANSLFWYRSSGVGSDL